MHLSYNHGYDQMNWGITEIIKIDGEDVIVEYVIDIAVINMSSEIPDFSLWFQFLKGEDRFIQPQIVAYSACRNDTFNGHNYKPYEIPYNCNNPIDVNFSVSYPQYIFSLNKGDIELNSLGYTPVEFRVTFRYPDLLLKDLTKYILE